MRRTLATGLVALAASPAFAGGIERNPQSMAILFQQGNYVELGVAHARPKVSGTTGPAFGSAPTGNITRRFTTGSLSFKGDFNEQLSYALILDQPFGADTLYPTGSPLAGSTGQVENTMLTGVMRYKFDGGFSAHAGLRSSWTSGSVSLPFAGGYTMSTDRDQAWGYLLGVAYEMPEIALRVALTYNSRIKHSFSATETIPAHPLSPFSTSFDTNLPASVNLEFQTGVAEDTLVFGSVRWVNWKDFMIQPTMYNAAISTTPLVDYDRNSITYTLGVGRRFNENWSGSVSLAHDTGNGRETGNLGPIGKRNTLGLGISYTKDAMTISAGVQYARLGGVTTRPPVNSQFGKNSAIGAGVRIGYRF
ncbi:outer membrane protein transport protein [Natronohydrobacter thiooxidans]|uniref:outer membrane protein transport protein n=1 Tax=Natronohydrobacter thiooxidans TaxID=87172 RepID=UPI0008FF3D43|nr:outer membrane protein transport protein [Natronohydrobacter thiooxidans]